MLPPVLALLTALSDLSLVVPSVILLYHALRYLVARSVHGYDKTIVLKLLIN